MKVRSLALLVVTMAIVCLGILITPIFWSKSPEVQENAWFNFYDLRAQQNFVGSFDRVCTRLRSKTTLEEYISTEGKSIYPFLPIESYTGNESKVEDQYDALVFLKDRSEIQISIRVVKQNRKWKVCELLKLVEVHPPDLDQLLVDSSGISDVGTHKFEPGEYSSYTTPRK